ncbi:hypothetical protein [Clostridium pasteurianum]|nr:hypothetical protein [Clostridium pasteurianum]
MIDNWIRTGDFGFIDSFLLNLNEKIRRNILKQIAIQKINSNIVAKIAVN